MARCLNCKVSIPNSKEFCGDRCSAEYIEYNPNKIYEPKPCFRLIGAALENMFYKVGDQDNNDYNINIEFIKSKVVSAWCDCSDNFTVNKLLKEYGKKFKASSIKDCAVSAGQIRPVLENARGQDGDSNTFGKLEMRFVPSNSS